MQNIITMRITLPLYLEMCLGLVDILCHTVPSHITDDDGGNYIRAGTRNMVLIFAVELHPCQLGGLDEDSYG